MDDCKSQLYILIACNELEMVVCVYVCVAEGKCIKIMMMTGIGKSLMIRLKRLGYY